MKNNTYKKLDEKKIKAILIDELIKNNPKNKIICSEVPFLGGKRWVDILEIKENSLVAYEIKSDLDNLSTIEGQINDYAETFNEVYLVLSKRFIDKYKVPKKIGYFSVDSHKKIISLKRRSIKRTYLSKENLSYFLWREDIPSLFKKKHEDMISIRKKLIQKITTKNLHQLAIKALEKRYRHRFDLFLKERSNKTHFSDISVLTKKETRIG